MNEIEPVTVLNTRQDDVGEAVVEPQPPLVACAAKKIIYKHRHPPGSPTGTPRS